MNMCTEELRDNTNLCPYHKKTITFFDKKSRLFQPVDPSKGNVRPSKYIEQYRDAPKRINDKSKKSSFTVAMSILPSTKYSLLAPNQDGDGQ